MNHTQPQSRRKQSIIAFALIAVIVLTGACDTARNNNTTTASQNAANMMSMNGNMNSNMNAMTVGRLETFYEHQSGYEPEQNVRGENYERVAENPFLEAARTPLSTFSIDVDTASYSNTRRFIGEGTKPPPDAVRIEEFINYFTYDYPQPVGDAPFSVTTETAQCPWNPRHRLVHIGLQGRRIQNENLPPANLVFLLDVSGSMQDAAKLPLVQRALKILVEQMTARDRISIVVYAGASGLALPSTSGERKRDIINAIDNLEAGGSTNGGEGIELAYRIASQNFIQGGTNRVILATDGDFNVGVTSENELVRLIEEKRKGGVFLSVLGFGTGNLNDATMEKLADKGNGNYAYIDSFEEARKVFGQEIGGTLVAIAKDVKIQVEFNPSAAAAYRLIGYENRLLADRDFNDDTKDAGEIGAGKTVTALYEVVPYGERVDGTDTTPLKYQPNTGSGAMRGGGELMTVQLRYKEPEGEQSKLLSIGVADTNQATDTASENFRFAAAVAAFGMLLKDSRHKGAANLNNVRLLAQNSIGADLHGQRAEFVRLVGEASRLNGF
ncbi:MAG: VWA domain-containing protein [Pyrinomonadaceae bacterium MAG19_C2-C3]|nr:VWA domain-containing protein [Pyrinomonadaceae bacterium MAG19_C2-C3]